MQSRSVTHAPQAPGWKQTLEDRLPLYGHRNWIVIADSAYPEQARAGIETITSHAGQIEVVEGVLAALASSKHVKPIVYTDHELAFVNEEDAPGIGAYRDRLSEVLGRSEVKVLAHEQIIQKLDEAAKSFRVLIIKTDMTIPYTSVFLELDCAYWGGDAEAALRKAMR
ncbi:MAG TPA: RbsD/FucU domain-containing protein [Clostridia bacterium]|nr:RbsD/FucU domain-containing protein [Clostridia bacterium]